MAQLLMRSGSWHPQLVTAGGGHTAQRRASPAPGPLVGAWSRSLDHQRRASRRHTVDLRLADQRARRRFVKIIGAVIIDVSSVDSTAGGAVGGLIADGVIGRSSSLGVVTLDSRRQTSSVDSLPAASSMDSMPKVIDGSTSTVSTSDSCWTCRWPSLPEASSRRRSCSLRSVVMADRSSTPMLVSRR